MENKKRTGFHDVTGEEICVGMICFDEENNVSDIEIEEFDGVFYATPKHLDSEPLDAVFHALRIVSK